ncbi:MAG: integrase core domain-containing protein [Flavobacterium haoranii]
MKIGYKAKKIQGLSFIHHSDRGLQYCANEYQKILAKNRIKPSMAQNSDPYENAVAERINGILKQEFNIHKYNKEIPIMKKIITETIEIYSEKRPHLSNQMLTPNQMHQQNKLKMKTYKTKNTCKNVLASV